MIEQLVQDGAIPLTAGGGFLKNLPDPCLLKSLNLECVILLLASGNTSITNQNGKNSFHKRSFMKTAYLKRIESEAQMHLNSAK